MKNDQSIFGYSFNSILEAQQGRGSLRPFSGKSATPVTVFCIGCSRPFRLPVNGATKRTKSQWPIECPICRHQHTREDAKDAGWL